MEEKWKKWDLTKKFWIDLHKIRNKERTDSDVCDRHSRTDVTYCECLTLAKDMKKSWSGVNRDISPGNPGSNSGPNLFTKFLYALNDIRNPPLSAKFSPWVSTPLTWRKYQVSSISIKYQHVEKWAEILILTKRPVVGSRNDSYSFMKHSVRLLYSRSVLELHQFLRLPYLSYCFPSSSNPWMISWPIVLPMAPKFTDAGPPKV